MSMRAGRLDRLITIQERTRVQNGTGEYVDAWADAFGGPQWAEKISGKGVERYLGATLAAVTETAFRLRWYPGLLTIYPDTHRVIYTDQGGAEHLHLIHGANEIGRREGVILHCKGRGENPVSDIPDAAED